MAKVVIADTSCLIVLAKIDKLEILKKTFGEVTITPEVFREYALPLPAWMRIQAVSDETRKETLLSLLDVGEASSIALGLETPGALLILDEKRGRNVAEKMGLATIGTLGVLLEAKRCGAIKQVRPIILELLKTDFRIARRLIDSVLLRAGEEIL